MKVYITADYPFIIKKNGGVLSSVTDFVKADADKSDFFEIYPVIPQMPRVLVFNENFIASYDKNIIKVDLKGGYFVKLLQSQESEKFSVISQTKLCGALVTVYCDNGRKISVETNNDFLVFPVTDEVETSEFIFDGKKFIACKCKNRLIILDVSGKIKKCLDCAADEWILTDGLKSINKLKDMAKHVVTTNFHHNGEFFVPQKSSVGFDQRFSPHKLPIKHLPFAFAEELIAGGELTSYLTIELADKTDELKAYFGKALGVFPPPEFKNPFNPMILYKRGENSYFTRYLSVEFQGRLIKNLKLNDF